MFVNKTTALLAAITFIGACGGVEAENDESTLGISGKKAADAVETAEVMMVDPLCGLIEVPSEDYTVGLDDNTVAAKLLGGSAGIVQVNTNWELSTYFYSEWHKWEIAIAPTAGSFAPEDPDCAVAGRSNDLQDLLRLWVSGVSGTPAAAADGRCTVDTSKEHYINVRPLFSSGKSCADVLCRFKLVDTSC